MFVAREKELDKLNKRYQSDTMEFIVVYGRRRVGKTALINEFVKDKPFSATAVYYKGKWYWWNQYTKDLLAEYGERCNVGLLDKDVEITAWMPLLEPYGGDQNG